MDIIAQHPLAVYDEDKTLLGEFAADLFVEKQLIVELKAGSKLRKEHVTQLLGYLRSARIETGLLINFGAPRTPNQKIPYVVGASLTSVQSLTFCGLFVPLFG